MVTIHTGKTQHHEHGNYPYGKTNLTNMVTHHNHRYYQHGHNFSQAATINMVTKHITKPVIAYMEKYITKSVMNIKGSFSVDALTTLCNLNVICIIQCHLSPWVITSMEAAWCRLTYMAFDDYAAPAYVNTCSLLDRITQQHSPIYDHCLLYLEGLCQETFGAS